MDFVKGMAKLLAVAALVAVVAVVAYLVGFGSGYYAARLTAPVAALQTAPLQPSAGATSAAPAPSPTRSPARATPTPPAGASDDEEQAFQVFWEAWKLLKDEYYGDLPDPQKMTRAAIRGVLETLDDKSTGLIEPDISKILNQDSSGEFEGIGATVRINKDNNLEIVRPFAGQPAEKAGVKAGDVVIAVDGKSIAGFSVYEAVGVIRGPAGTTVKLTIVRAGEVEPLEISVPRAKITIPIVQSKMLDGDIAYVSLFDFSSPSSGQLESELETLLAEKPKGLILDLRDNPGSGPNGIAQDVPLVVLVNGGSASASEIVAGALQDRGRAKLIGETTFGKGSVQLPHELSDGSELRVTIAHWFTPDGRQIHGKGLTPDIVVPLTEDDVKANRDTQLERAVQFLLGK
jgi:carboxyl-terminal processing protease